MLQVQGFVGRLVVSSLDGERRGIHADLHRRWPVRVHLPVLMVVALKLQLQVRPDTEQQFIIIIIISKLLSFLYSPLFTLYMT